jgi:hypothetical protein
MSWLSEKKVNLRVLINPFFLYCASFILAVAIYFLGWSSIFPRLSAGLLLFLASTIILFFVGGIILKKKNLYFSSSLITDNHINDIIFFIIIILGVINVSFMGYIPVLDRSHNYREFGMPVVDPVFNTLSIFFSTIYFHNYLQNKKKKNLVYFIIILLIQIILFRRSTIVWIVISSSLLYILFKQRVSLLVIALSIISIPLASYCFGYYGDVRSKLSKSFVLNDLGASDKFRNSQLSHNHYMTYLYVSSPLANLQKNIDFKDNGVTHHDFREFLFYCVIPESITSRLEKPLNLIKPDCQLISPNLIVGSLYMVSFFTMGWAGMIMMFLFLSGVILAGLLIINRWKSFGMETFSILSTAVSILIFSNFLNRLDVLLMLFVYPVLFHYIYTSGRNPEILKAAAQL